MLLPQSPAAGRRRGRSDCPSKEGSSSEAAKPRFCPLWKRKKVGQEREGARAPGEEAVGKSGRPGGARAWVEPAARRRISVSDANRFPAPPPPPALGARLRRSAAAPAFCSPRRSGGRLYLSSARAATRHSPGARGRGGWSAAGLAGAHGGALALCTRLRAALGGSGGPGRRAERASEKGGGGGSGARPGSRSLP